MQLYLGVKMQAMFSNKPVHTFHIPVMGLAYTIDTPICVAHFGISSVISIIDDDLIEKMNALYCEKYNFPHEPITEKSDDHRAQRITSYLNLVDKIVKLKFQAFKDELAQSEVALQNFMAMLPSRSDLKLGLENLLLNGGSIKDEIKVFLDNHLRPGDIDVNIMTKIDKDNFYKGNQLSVAFNDAHASLRGFANSVLNSSVVLSAGLNPRLYSYFEKFNDFFPDSDGRLKKKIILKVSDFRSAFVQGSFLAKKGLWVSEYRIESGLNCGGHAFATEGYLLGPILDEFKAKKAFLVQSAHELMGKALAQKGMDAPIRPLDLKITVQGGVGTAQEHDFLLKQYGVDSVGWGTPFLLVPEATSVDGETRGLLAKATEKDVYLSQISPLGVPFNTLKGTTNEVYKQERIHQNKAGSSCPKKLLALSKEFGPEGICTASKKYQDVKLGELETQKTNLTADAYRNAKDKITEKACLCVGLANAAFLENNIKIKGQAQGVVICPGPNLAYFDKQVSLSTMVQHIYGQTSVLSCNDRPHMFAKELGMYVDYLKNDIEKFSLPMTTGQTKKWQLFRNNLLDGIAYYQALFSGIDTTENQKIQDFLIKCQDELAKVIIPELEMA